MLSQEMSKEKNIQRFRRYLWRILEFAFNELELIAKKADVQLAFQVFDFEVNPANNPPRQYHQRDLANSGILIQGPISNPDFLNRTISHYRRIYPAIPIVLSTWENDANLEKIQDNGDLKLVLNTPPKSSGISNLNFQAKSTYAGILKIQELGCSHILKMRTDQAIFNSRSIEILLNRLKFAPKNEYKRILTTDFNTFLFRPYSPNDQFMFGESASIHNFWNAYMKNTEIGLKESDFAEKILLRHYLSYLGINFENTEEQSLKLYRDLYTIVDNEEIDLYWAKGTHRNLRSRFPQQSFPSRTSFLRYSDWQALQDDLTPYLNFFKEVTSHH